MKSLKHLAALKIIDTHSTRDINRSSLNVDCKDFLWKCIASQIECSLIAKLEVLHKLQDRNKHCTLKEMLNDYYLQINVSDASLPKSVLIHSDKVCIYGVREEFSVFLL